MTEETPDSGPVHGLVIWLWSKVWRRWIDDGETVVKVLGWNEALIDSRGGQRRHCWCLLRKPKVGNAIVRNSKPLAAFGKRLKRNEDEIRRRLKEEQPEAWD